MDAKEQSSHMESIMSEAAQQADVSAEHEQVVAVIKKELEDCQIQQQAWKEKFVQMNADFQNLQRRLSKEQSQWVHNAQAKILTDLLPIVDDFDRAIIHISESDEHPASKGFLFIYRAFQKFLKEHGVQEFSSYEQFDPMLHEALMQVKSEKHKPGTIVQVLRKGYRLNGSLLRIAQVSVAE